MNTELIEHGAAAIVARLAQELAQQRSNPCDVKAASVAIAVRAVEILTPGMADDLRASLFLHKE